MDKSDFAMMMKQPTIRGTSNTPSYSFGNVNYSGYVPATYTLASSATTHAGTLGGWTQ